MSLPVNNLACTLADIPIKTFVKEKGDVSKNEKKDKFNLEFKGNEAKLAYEEIVSYKNRKKSVMPKCNTVSVNEQKLKCVNPVKSVHTVKTDNTNVTNVNTLFKAIEAGDIKFISQNFNSKNVNICDQFGWTPLMSAAYSGHINIVDFLLKLDANTTLTDKSGFTALDLALKNNHVNIVDLMKQYVHKRRSKRVFNKYEKVTDLRNDNKEIDEKGFYCDVCKIFFMESSRIKHESSTLHVFNSEPKLRNTFYGISKQNKGYQMLLNTGWNEENGLGPSGEGQKYPVKTVLKRDRKGFGQSNKDIARVTHFNSKDTNAVKYVHKNRKKYNKKQWEIQLKKDVIKTQLLRRALS